MFQKAKKFLLMALPAIITAAFMVGLVVLAQTTWQEPTKAPPEDNVPAPINVGDNDQAKLGSLVIGRGFTTNDTTKLAVTRGFVEIGSVDYRAGFTTYGTTKLANSFGNVEIGSYATNSMLNIEYKDTAEYNIYPMLITNKDYLTEGPLMAVRAVDGHVGIGTIAPRAKLHIIKSWEAYPLPETGGDSLALLISEDVSGERNHIGIFSELPNDGDYNPMVKAGDMAIVFATKIFKGGDIPPAKGSLYIGPWTCTSNDPNCDPTKGPIVTNPKGIRIDANGNVSIGYKSDLLDETRLAIQAKSGKNALYWTQNTTQGIGFLSQSGNNILIGARTTPSANLILKAGGLNKLFIDNSTTDTKIGIGTTNPQGALDIWSTQGGFIVPRMTTAQRDTPTFIAVNGMIIYNTTTNQFNFRENGAWVLK